MVFTDAVVSVVQSTLGATGTFEGISITVGSLVLLGLVIFGGKKLYDALKPKK
jgi:hypothetical protein